MIYDVQKRASAIPPTSAISSNGGWGGDFPAGSGWGKSFIETGSAAANSYEALLPPFFITTSFTGAGAFYKISPTTSIINGTNGGPFAISDLDKDLKAEAGFIVAEAEVTASPFEIKNNGFKITIVQEDETDEVFTGDDGTQSKLRLLIGRLVELDDFFVPIQAAFTSFKTAVSFVNGVPVYVLQSAPTHQSKLVIKPLT